MCQLSDLLDGQRGFLMKQAFVLKSLKVETITRVLFTFYFINILLKLNFTLTSYLAS